mgnify:CR=1 FL=1
MADINFMGRLSNLWSGFVSLWITDVEKRHPEIAYQNAIDSMIEKYGKLKSATAAIMPRCVPVVPVPIWPLGRAQSRDDESQPSSRTAVLHHSSMKRPPARAEAGHPRAAGRAQVIPPPTETDLTLPEQPGFSIE